jgi:hypothetical protein
MERDRRREAMPLDDREVLVALLCLRGLVAPSPAWEDPAAELGAEGGAGAGVLSHEMVACLRMTPGLEEAREAAWSPGEEEECVRVGGLPGVASRDARCRL